jgi:TM2 domain-containing membrane protein YozV
MEKALIFLYYFLLFICLIILFIPALILYLGADIREKYELL